MNVRIIMNGFDIIFMNRKKNIKHTFYIYKTIKYLYAVKVPVRVQGKDNHDLFRNTFKHVDNKYSDYLFYFILINFSYRVFKESSFCFLLIAILIVLIQKKSTKRLFISNI